MYGTGVLLKRLLESFNFKSSQFSSLKCQMLPDRGNYAASNIHNLLCSAVTALCAFFFFRIKLKTSSNRWLQKRIVFRSFTTNVNRMFIVCCERNWEKRFLFFFFNWCNLSLASLQPCQTAVHLFAPKCSVEKPGARGANASRGASNCWDIVSDISQTGIKLEGEGEKKGRWGPRSKGVSDSGTVTPLIS